MWKKELLKLWGFLQKTLLHKHNYSDCYSLQSCKENATDTCPMSQRYLKILNFSLAPWPWKSLSSPGRISGFVGQDLQHSEAVPLYSLEWMKEWMSEWKNELALPFAQMRELWVNSFLIPSGCLIAVKWSGRERKVQNITMKPWQFSSVR